MTESEMMRKWINIIINAGLAQNLTSVDIERLRLQLNKGV